MNEQAGDLCEGQDNDEYHDRGNQPEQHGIFDADCGKNGFEKMTDGTGQYRAQENADQRKRHPDGTLAKTETGKRCEQQNGNNPNRHGGELNFFQFKKHAENCGEEEAESVKSVKSVKRVE
jgi:hypothetical protein